MPDHPPAAGTRGRSWTPPEEDLLRTMTQTGRSVAEIASELDRTPVAVSARRRKLAQDDASAGGGGGRVRGSVPGGANSDHSTDRSVNKDDQGDEGEGEAADAAAGEGAGNLARLRGQSEFAGASIAAAAAASAAGVGQQQQQQQQQGAGSRGVIASTGASSYVPETSNSSGPSVPTPGRAVNVAAAPMAAPQFRAWSTNDDFMLADLTEQMKTTHEIALILGRSDAAVNVRRSKLKLGSRARLRANRTPATRVPWSMEEEEVLRNGVAQGKTSREIAIQLGRSLAAVNVRRCKLSVTCPLTLSRVVWTPEDDARLNEMANNGMSSHQIAETLNRTPAAVNVRRSKLRMRSDPPPAPGMVLGSGGEQFRGHDSRTDTATADAARQQMQQHAKAMAAADMLLAGDMQQHVAPSSIAAAGATPVVRPPPQLQKSQQQQQFHHDAHHHHHDHHQDHQHDHHHSHHHHHQHHHAHDSLHPSQHDDGMTSPLSVAGKQQQHQQQQEGDQQSERDAVAGTGSASVSISKSDGLDAGIHQVKRRRWTAGEDLRLMELADSGFTATMIAHELGRSIGAVSIRRCTLRSRGVDSGLRQTPPAVPKRPWTEEDRERLEAMVRQGKSDAMIAQAMGRSVGAVQNRRSILGLAAARRVRAMNAGMANEHAVGLVQLHEQAMQQQQHAGARDQVASQSEPGSMLTDASRDIELFPGMATHARPYRATTPHVPAANISSLVGHQQELPNLVLSQHQHQQQQAQPRQQLASDSDPDSTPDGSPGVQHEDKRLSSLLHQPGQSQQRQHRHVDEQHHGQQQQQQQHQQQQQSHHTGAGDEAAGEQEQTDALAGDFAEVTAMHHTPRQLSSDLGHADAYRGLGVGAADLPSLSHGYPLHEIAEARTRFAHADGDTDADRAARQGHGAGGAAGAAGGGRGAARRTGDDTVHQRVREDDDDPPRDSDDLTRLLHDVEPPSKRLKFA